MHFKLLHKMFDMGFFENFGAKNTSQYNGIDVNNEDERENYFTVYCKKVTIPTWKAHQEHVLHAKHMPGMPYTLRTSTALHVFWLTIDVSGNQSIHHFLFCKYSTRSVREEKLESYRED